MALHQDVVTALVTAAQLPPAGVTALASQPSLFATAAGGSSSSGGGCSLAQLAGGGFLISGSRDATVMVWDLAPPATGRSSSRSRTLPVAAAPRHVLYGHRDKVGGEDRKLALMLCL